MTDTDRSFGSAVTPPYRPQPLIAPAYGEESVPASVEEAHPSFDEATIRAHEEGLAPRPLEGEAAHRSPTSTSGGGTSAFIVGRDREERYRCEICDTEFDSEEELERHTKRVGLVE